MRGNAPRTPCSTVETSLDMASQATLNNFRTTASHYVTA
jgi:hypothetical protein